MGRVNITFDNASPFIQYSPPGAWTEGDGAKDPSLSQYFFGTYTSTNVTGASASFSLNYTGIWIFGAKRKFHGTYNITLDDAVFHGTSFADPDQFQTPFFTALNLESRRHTVTLINSPTEGEQNTIDIDYIVVEVDSVNNDEIVRQDTSPSFNYRPAGNWTTTLANLTSFAHASAHATNVSGASATLEFLSDRVTLYGATGPNFGPYTVKVDEGLVTIFNATKRDFFPSAMLFHASLNYGKHTLEVVNQPSVPGQQFAIDFAIISAPPPRMIGGEHSEQAAFSKHASPSLNAWIVATIVLSTIVILALLLGLVYYIRWRRQRKQTAKNGSSLPWRQTQKAGSRAFTYSTGLPSTRQLFSDRSGSIPSFTPMLTRSGSSYLSRDSWVDVKSVSSGSRSSASSRYSK